MTLKSVLDVTGRDILIKHLPGIQHTKTPSGNLYVRFVHQNRALPYCYIGKESKPEGDLQVAREYYRSAKVVRTYSFRSGGNFIIEKHESSKAIPIVIYCFYKPHAMTKRLKKSSLKLEEIEWLLKDKTLVDKYPYPMPRQFLTNIQNSKLYCKPNTNVIVTFGENAVKEADKISSSSSFIGNVTTLIDKFGVMKKIIERRNLSEKLSEGHFGSKNNYHTGIFVETPTTTQ